MIRSRFFTAKAESIYSEIFEFSERDIFQRTESSGRNFGTGNRQTDTIKHILMKEYMIIETKNIATKP
jgi:hypothetical protein